MNDYQVEGRKSDAFGGEKAPKPPGQARLGFKGWLRWMWRQLTSMRVALILLLILAVAAVPGMFFPQRSANPIEYRAFAEEHPELTPVLERFYLFEVYSSPWFTAIYLMLFISLVGCIIPRAWTHLRHLTTPPGLVPRRFNRFPAKVAVRTDLKPEVARSALVAGMGRVYRRRLDTEADGALTVSAERGYGRELGNLLFHLALVGILVTAGWGSLVQYRGQAVVIEGNSFVNSVVDYNTFESGAWFSESSMESYRFTLESFYSEFTENGSARDFEARVQVVAPDGQTYPETIRVNHPLNLGQARVYLQGNGYAPEITVTDVAGDIAYQGPVIFLPQDDMYVSTGVIHVPDANGGDPQWGFTGSLLPTAIPSDDGAFAGSGHPLPLDPVVTLQMYVGDLGLDQGYATNLWQLDTEDLDQITTEGDDGTEVPFRAVLRPGETVELPTGGSISMGEIRRFVALDLRYDPSIIWMGVSAGLALVGLIGSLFIPRRRLWLRIRENEDGTTTVYSAALSRGDDQGLQRDLDRVLKALERKSTDGAG